MRDVAIVGAGQTPYGDHPEAGIKELFASAFGAMADSVDRGFDATALDAAYVGSLGVGGSQLGITGASLTSHLGLTGLPVQRVENACASGGFALLDAVHAVGSGASDAVLAAGVEKMLDLSGDRSKYWLGVSGDTEYERLAGMTFAGVYAIAARRYLHETDAEREHLSRVAVKNHENGAVNPKAQFQREVSLERATGAPEIAAPLNLYDACPTTDGAACALVVPADEAREYTDDPVYVTGFGGGSDHLALHDRETITSLSAVREAAEAAYDRADKTPEDVDFAEVHDCFTIAELLAYEDLGFADRGEGWRLIAEGRTRRDGDLPVNTSGGLKAKGHPLGATGIGQVVEVFDQLRGDAGDRQVDGDVALSHNVGGSGGAATVFIYEVDA
ncbi:thiolase domain-containing protein [Haloferax denitrificans]|uniref:Thiolase n=1 Tax=Haloferax denitrificans ATCC 35960 TaxID=662478 RepID=M0J2E7_9EURY|nr:thiolase domain-containing protein [Haloferax denitrificans]EMA03111.1 thiolase [Haloferax denitrificans ATCC 35960]